MRKPHCVANDLEQREGICTGRAVIHLDEKHGKGDAAREIVRATGAEYVIALGDSRGDLGMFGVADYSIAIGKAHPSVVESADAHFINPDLGVVAEAIAARDYLI